MYTTADLSALFGVSQQAIRSRSDEFEEYLSRGAVPEPGQQRLYTDADCEVMITINELHNSGWTIPLIKAELANTKRARATLPKSIAKVLPKSEQLAEAEALALELQEKLKASRTENNVLREQLAEARAEIKALNREIGRMEAGKE